MAENTIVDERYNLTERDLGIFELMGVFAGKTSLPVLARTFWHDAKRPEAQARMRIDKLRKKGLIKPKNTGLLSPRSYYIPTAAGREIIEDRFGIHLSSSPHFSLATYWHNAYEQIAWYWLRKFGRDPQRTIVKKWSRDHHHTPDLYYINQKGKIVYVEIEISKKNAESYSRIFTEMKKDGIGAVLYVFEDEKKMRQIGRVLPVWDPVRYVTIEQMIGADRLPAVKQSDFLLKIGEMK
ncbi:MAG: hypothetical protein GXO25_07975 [Euryarchaeota archaeon]|nr:hypothetical protein [Euryarchaeota archaeon]